VGVHKGYDYSRTANPTRRALEECLASLEGAAHGLAFSSGMGAITTVLHLLAPGDRVVSVDDVYGGTYRISRVYADRGIRFDFAAAEALNGPEPAVLAEPARLVWVETPTNPLLGIVDIRTVAAAAHAAGALCVVDNTFATPFLQRPIELGADLVVHSTTKYLGGHSDVVGGFAATSDPELAARLAYLQNALGAVPGPLDAWLVLRGLKTLAVRMRQHCTNAREIAGFLEQHPAVEHVRYPGLASHPQRELAASQMDDFGGMVSFEVVGGEAAARRVAESTRLFTLAESLGGVESLIELPAPMTHATLAGSPFEVPPGLIRLSVGIESASDLIADLDQALGRSG
jgi:cystathionine beta-lyase/cystathionine gamma-synthase